MSGNSLSPRVYKANTTLALPESQQFSNNIEALSGSLSTRLSKSDYIRLMLNSTKDATPETTLGKVLKKACLNEASITEDCARGEPVSVRLTEKQEASFKTQASVFDVSLSQWLRTLCITPIEISEQGIISVMCYPTEDLKKCLGIFTKIQKELVRWGYHYDQTLYALNALKLRNWLASDDMEQHMIRTTEEMNETKDATILIYEAVVEGINYLYTLPKAGE